MNFTFMVHIGKKIRQVIKERRISIVEFAVRINKSRTVVYDIFERKTIDTELLYKIGQELDYDFFQYFISPDLQFVQEDVPSYGKNRNAVKNKTYSALSHEVAEIKKQLDDAIKEISYLKKINGLLEKGGHKKKLK